MKKRALTIYWHQWNIFFFMNIVLVPERERRMIMPNTKKLNLGWSGNTPIRLNITGGLGLGAFYTCSWARPDNMPRKTTRRGSFPIGAAGSQRIRACSSFITASNPSEASLIR